MSKRTLVSFFYKLNKNQAKTMTERIFRKYFYTFYEKKRLTDKVTGKNLLFI